MSNGEIRKPDFGVNSAWTGKPSKWSCPHCNGDVSEAWMDEAATFECPHCGGGVTSKDHAVLLCPHCGKADDKPDTYMQLCTDGTLHYCLVCSRCKEITKQPMQSLEQAAEQNKELQPLNEALRTLDKALRDSKNKAPSGQCPDEAFKQRSKDK